MYTVRDLSKLIEKARAGLKKIVLPESTDPRVLAAASRLYREGVARVLLPGDIDSIERAAKAADCNIGGAELIDQSARTDACAETLWQLRRHKGLTREQAREQINDPLTFANILLRQGEADGCVAGACYPTAKVVRSALQIVGKHPDSSLVSSFFPDAIQQTLHRFSRAMLFADCAMVIEPSAEQLADIAVATADNATHLLGIEPRVAMLSFSTQGSTEHALVDKVVEATRMAKNRRPHCDILAMSSWTRHWIRKFWPRKRHTWPVIKWPMY